MKKYMLFFVCLFVIGSLFGMNEWEDEAVDSSASRNVDELMRDFFSGYNLSDKRLKEIEGYLYAIPYDAYVDITAKTIPRRGSSGLDEEKNAARVVQTLAMIAHFLDQQNKLLVEQQERERARASNADIQTEEQVKERAFKRYKWHVSTALGAIGTVVSTAMAIWQGDVATQCVTNSTG